jgi:mono/diheme cytochrome c family protein
MTRWLGVAAVVVLLVGGLVARGGDAQPKGDPAKGEALYKARCVTCHGPAGAGDGPTGKVLKDKPKDWTKGEGLKDFSDQQLADAIKKGGTAVGRSPAMIAFPGLSDAEIQNVIAYIKTLVKS